MIATTVVDRLGRPWTAVTDLASRMRTIDVNDRHTASVGGLTTGPNGDATPVRLMAFAPAVVAIALWWVALRTSGSPTSMTDLGLLSILSPAYYVGLAFVVVGFWRALRGLRASVLVVHVLVLLAMLHLTPAILYGTLRYTWAWKHVAIIDYVIGNHGVDLTQPIPSLVAYQDWPGFFSLQALLTSGAGLHNPVTFASYWPFVNEVTYAGPLLLLFRTFTADRRTVWIALLLFYLGNWVGQDYFSPQGEAYFLYLVLLAVVLKYFRRGAADPAIDGIGVHSDGLVGDHRAWAIKAVIALVMLAIASSHQLTPFMVVSALFLLAVFGCLRSRSLAVMALVIAVGWIAFAARTFVADNGPSMIQGIGALLSNAEVNQVNTAQASHDQLLVLKIDRLLSAGLILLAVTGFFRGRTKLRDRRWLPAVLLAISPAFALGANNYGGEVVFRVYLFSLPLLALLGARAFGTRIPRSVAARAISGLGHSAIVGAIVVGFLFSYYGKERSNYYSPNEVTSMARFYALAPPGSYITGVAGNNPWPLIGYEKYVQYWYIAVAPKAAQQLVADPVRTLTHDMAEHPNPFLLFTASDAAQVEMTGALPRGAYAHIEQAVIDSGRFEIVEQTPTVLVLTLKRTAPTGSATGAT